MKLSRKAWTGIVCLALFGLWWGVPTLNKWRADKLVDELCAKDGGVRVYETVALPKERFTPSGEFRVLAQQVMGKEDEFYRISRNTNIKGRHESSDIGALTVYQDHDQIYRSIDMRLLGESINYVRRGGDPIGPWMPSAYSCPGTTDNDLTKQIFLIATNKQ